MTPLIPLRLTEKGRASIRASKAVKCAPVLRQLEAVRRLRTTVRRIDSGVTK